MTASGRGDKGRPHPAPTIVGGAKTLLAKLPLETLAPLIRCLFDVCPLTCLFSCCIFVSNVTVGMKDWKGGKNSKSEKDHVRSARGGVQCVNRIT